MKFAFVSPPTSGPIYHWPVDLRRRAYSLLVVKDSLPPDYLIEMNLPKYPKMYKKINKNPETFLLGIIGTEIPKRDD